MQAQGSGHSAGPLRETWQMLGVETLFEFEMPCQVLNQKLLPNLTKHDRVPFCLRKAAKDLQALKKIQKSKGEAHESVGFIIAKLLTCDMSFQPGLRSKGAHVLEQHKSSTGGV